MQANKGSSSTVSVTSSAPPPGNGFNSLFEKWLGEWRIEAQRRDLRTQYLYAKAIKTLKKYPLPLKSAAETLDLDNFGPATVKKLEARLEKYCLEHNIQPPAKSPQVIQRSTSKTKKSGTSKDNDGDSTTEASAASKKRTKAYVPGPRTGAAAILIALHYLSEDENYIGYSTKPEIIQKAQPYSRTSFTVAEGSKFHTAWAGINKLVAEELVAKQGRVGAKYSLTAKGVDLARRCADVEKGKLPSPNKYLASATTNKRQCNRCGAISHLTKRSKKCPFYGTKDDEQSQSDGSNLVASSSVNPTIKEAKIVPPTQKSIVDAFGSDSEKKHFPKCDNCESAIAELNCLECNENFCKTCNYHTHLNSKKRVHTRVPLGDPSNRKRKMMYDERDGGKISLGSKENPSKKVKRLSIPANSCTTDISHKTPAGLIRNEFAGSTFSPVFSPIANEGDLEFLGVFPSSSGRNVPKQRVTSIDKGPTHLRCLRPGQYEIVLVIDTREHTGGPRDKGLIQERLMKYKVNTTVRPLSLGDFLWIVQEKVKPIPGQLHLPPSKELVLDYVAERKRMDDLVDSIIDGRYKEQKYRFQEAKIKNKIYLVEDYGNVDTKKISAKGIMQALANTEICDGFFVKHTANIDSTIAYLVAMTRKIDHMYSNCTVYIADSDDCPLPFKKTGSEVEYCTLRTFDDYNALTKKTKVYSVKTMMAQQLMQMALITPAKAAAIAKVYPTPRSIVEACETAKDTKERENLFANIKPEREKRLGISASDNIAHLYSDQVLQ
eukprot:m.53953 g.53953  ORF g.53953 m.53953 type:complete len:775 (-) comp10890_c0_seq2:50-2374(-)